MMTMSDETDRELWEKAAQAGADKELARARLLDAWCAEHNARPSECELVEVMRYTEDGSFTTTTRVRRVNANHTVDTRLGRLEAAVAEVLRILRRLCPGEDGE